MKIAVVTGASSGIGREFVYQIAKKYRTLDEIWVMARSVNKLNKIKDDIYPAIKIRVCGLDVTNPNDINRYSNMLENENPEIKVLVNAAGCGYTGRFDEISEYDNAYMCRLNCEALTRITRISIPYMYKGKANIINIASAASYTPQPLFATYAASKAYVLSLSRALNNELRKKNICVTAVCPGPVDTDFLNLAEKYYKVKLYKKLFRVKPDKVVSKALSDAYRKKEISIYGISMNAFSVLSKIIPHSFIIKFFN